MIIKLTTNISTVNLHLTIQYRSAPHKKSTIIIAATVVVKITLTEKATLVVILPRNFIPSIYQLNNILSKENPQFNKIRMNSHMRIRIKKSKTKMKMSMIIIKIKIISLITRIKNILNKIRVRFLNTT